MALIEKKLAGEEISVAPEPEERQPVPDLMAALQASLEQAKDDKRKGGAKPAAAKKKKAPAKEDEVSRAREGEGLDPEAAGGRAGAQRERRISSAPIVITPISRRTTRRASAPCSACRGASRSSTSSSSRWAAPIRIPSLTIVTDQDRDAVEVVQLVLGLVARDQEPEPERDLDHDDDLRDAQQVPEPDRRIAAQPGDRAPAADDRVGAHDHDPESGVKPVQQRAFRTM